MFSTKYNVFVLGMKLSKGQISHYLMDTNFSNNELLCECQNYSYLCLEITIVYIDIAGRAIWSGY